MIGLGLGAAFLANDEGYPRIAALILAATAYRIFTQERASDLAPISSPRPKERT